MDERWIHVGMKSEEEKKGKKRKGTMIIQLCVLRLKQTNIWVGFIHSFIVKNNIMLIPDCFVLSLFPSALFFCSMKKEGK